MIIKQLSTCDCKAELSEFVKGLFDIWKQDSSFSKDNCCCSQRSINEVMEKIDTVDGKTSEFLVAFSEITDSVCGMLYFSSNSNKAAHISLVNVDPKHRRMRVGFSLLSYCMVLFAKKGIDCAVLETWDDNISAITFFEEFGFTKTLAYGRTIELKSNFPAVLQEKYPNLESLSLDHFDVSNT
ncbi:MAG: GNAT family N-acetyltransferase [Oscillospiraceae bacterium]|nr:GNAT family N-acetyltransferase [Oscillospiraceae bacterium]